MLQIMAVPTIMQIVIVVQIIQKKKKAIHMLKKQMNTRYININYQPNLKGKYII